jgi:hypothetical protein
MTAGLARPTTRLLAAVLPAAGLLAPGRSSAADWEQDPIRYSTAPADNAMNRLEPKLADGSVKLTHRGDTGYLQSLLTALNVPESSQVLVFSKTSLQRHRIGPATPRAIYFNDDVYVGYCQKGDVMEVAAADPRLGTAFYTVGQKPGAPKVTRQAESCLLCHASSKNRGVPGHVVLSVSPDRDGEPGLSGGFARVDLTTPFADRWGGWYVTGTHGRMTHKGNRVGDADPAAGQNVTDLSGRFRTKPYLTPHSDLVALMVMEHQTAIHNRLARAALEGRVVLYRDDAGAESAIRELGDEVVDYLLFRNEARLTDRVAGTSSFAQEFAKRGPFDSKGRSLRQFDLKTWLFKYPCSYLVYSPAFQKLPAEIKDYTLKRMYAILTGAEGQTEFAHLSADDRRAIREILADTLPDKPDYWK